jgi:hypothetical protein
MITLKTLPAATLMEVFQQGSDHLFQQGGKSEYVDSEGTSNCLYRHGSMSCSGGCFISDEEYDPDMESRTWKALSEGSSFLVPDDHCILIGDLQHIHDNYDVERWPEKLAELKANIIKHPEDYVN